MRVGGNSEGPGNSESAPDRSHPAPEGPPIPGWAQASHRPPLNTYVTVICLVLVAIFLANLISFTFTGDRFLLLEEPAHTVTVVGEVTLILEEGLKNAPRWEQRFYQLTDRIGTDLHHEIRTDYLEVAQYLAQNPDLGSEPWVSGLDSRIAYLHAEAADGTDFTAVDPIFERSEAEFAFSRALRRAFDTPADSEHSFIGWEEALPRIHHRLLETSWTEEALGARLAEVGGDQAESARRIARLESAGTSLLYRLRIVDLAVVVAVIAGMWVLIARTRWFTQNVNAARGVTVPPWSFQYGMGVLLRCVAGSICVAQALLAISPMFANMMSVATVIPMVLIANAYLCQPDGRSFTSIFGISMGELSLGRLTLFALGLSAVNLLGSQLIHALAIVFSAELSWQEFVVEPLLWGPVWKAALLTFDGTIGAPIMEEIGFRGILYVTFRARYKASISAVLSAGIFAFLHLYSVVGFLEVFWTGLVLAVGYEKCRSLYPCIFAHVVNNLLFFTSLWLIYR
jgi:membrane protease YdiL (CAAX protease family)